LGTDQTGTTDKGNGVAGVSLFSANNTVGGTAPADRNLISGNTLAGVLVGTANATGNTILGNFIGTDDGGTDPLGNGGAGVRVPTGTDNIVGGTSFGAGNRIAFNAGTGIQIGATAGSGNALLGNTTFANGGLGIDLGANGVTNNDPLDADS